MNKNTCEFLITAQAYAKNDPYKQTILLHDTFFQSDKDTATKEFHNKFESDYKILKVFSAINLSDNQL